MQLQICYFYMYMVHLTKSKLVENPGNVNVTRQCAMSREDGAKSTMRTVGQFQHFGA